LGKQAQSKYYPAQGRASAATSEQKLRCPIRLPERPGNFVTSCHCVIGMFGHRGLKSLYDITS
jgi:hypothetical protein